MKRLFASILMVSFALSAQVFIEGVDINQLDDVQYCEVWGEQKTLSWKVRLFVDYGQKQSTAEEPHSFVAAGKDGKKLNFHSIMHALNFMYKNGWEYVEAFPLSSGVGKNKIYHFMLRRVKH